jgi:hypothetical protein
MPSCTPSSCYSNFRWLGRRCFCGYANVCTSTARCFRWSGNSWGMDQPSDYPLNPFKMKFDPPLFHPNSKYRSFAHIFNLTNKTCGLVYPDGNVCISILHSPGDDPMQYESASERWSPVQSVEKVLLSVISMLAGELFVTNAIS